MRAYHRWEENRYVEILRLYEEEMAGRKKAYDWKSPHVEAQLVKMGLEEPERDRESKARKRKQVAARHQSRSSNGATAAAMRQQHQQNVNAAAAAAAAAAGIYNQAPPRLPAMPPYHDQQPAYYSQPPAPGHYRTSSYDAAQTQQLAQELGAQPPELDDAQREQLVGQVLERPVPYGLMEQDGNNGHHPGEDPDTKMSDPYAGHHPHHLQEQQQHDLPPNSHWESRPRNTSTSMIHPALAGESSSHANSPAAGVYGPPGTPGAPSGASTGSPDFGVRHNTPVARNPMEETLSRPAYA